MAADEDRLRGESRAEMPPLRAPGHAPHRRGAPVEKPKNFKGTLKRLWNFFGREGKLLTAVLLFVVTDAALLLAVPYLTGRAVDFMAGGKGHVLFAPLRAVLAVLLAVFLADFALTFAGNFLMAGVSQRIVGAMRRALFGKLQHLELAYFDTHTHGDLMSRFTNDIDNISTTISSSTVSLMNDGTSIAGSLLMMLLLNVPLTLAGVAVVPLVLLLSKTVTSRTGKLFKEQQALLGRLGGHIEETVSGLSVVKAFNHEDAVVEQFGALNAELLRVGQKAQVISGYLMPMTNILSNLGYLMVAVVGGVLAVKGAITVGVIASFLSYVRQFSRPLNDVASTYNTLQTAVAGAERIFEVLDTPGERPDAPDAADIASPRGDVEFRDVVFSYRPGHPVLSGVSFSVPHGGTVALVGPTGAGKTTIASLVNRFYEIDSGAILLDGVDIRSYTRASLRRCFGVVLQDTTLFSGTVADNIRYGRPGATDAEVREAAEKADAAGFIGKLPRGYATQLAESGRNLSGGQRQLLAIARAVLADPAILILDEATSSVDTRTELRIQRAMADLMRDRTCFIIAHRLSTIREAGLILVIDEGRIVESGTHDSLMALHGFYRRLYDANGAVPTGAPAGGPRRPAAP